MSTVIKVENLSKRYRLGQISGGTLSEDLNRWLARMRGKPDPTLRIGEQDSLRHGEYIWALKDISFQVEQGEVLGIIGRNGAGKSTLLKVLSRITAPTAGMVKVKGRIASLLEVGTGFHPELTGRENIYLNGAILGMRRKEIARKFDEIVAFAEVEQFIDTPVKRYSSGMYVRLAFAVAAHLEPEILLVDEVLAVGDAEFQKKCLGKMGEVAQEGRTVLFVSHNMNAVVSLCEKCNVFDRGILVYQGNTDDAVKYYYDIFQPGKDRDNGHVLYQSINQEIAIGTNITCIEWLNFDYSPKPFVLTWDDVVFRVHYHTDRDYEHGSIILDIRDYKNNRLLVFDSGLKIPLKAGEHYIDCFVPKIPLPSGDYYLGAGLALSNSGWLWRETTLAGFQIQGKDVYNLGRAPDQTRMAMAIYHEWKPEVN